MANAPRSSGRVLRSTPRGALPTGVRRQSMMRASGIVSPAYYRTSVQEAEEALLGKMAIVGEDLVDALVAHDVHGNAINEAILLVGAALVESEAGEEGVVGLMGDFDRGIDENRTDEVARALADLIAKARNAGEEFA